MKDRQILNQIYQRLLERFGPQGWWPAGDPFEIIIGAILTQNTAWKNVEKVIENLKREGLLSPEKMRKVPLKRLSRLIRPAGYYNQKAKRLKEFLEFIFSNYKGDVREMFKDDYLELRAKLLKIKGIGLETADSILLYAANKPIFVIDTYTKRILLRHNLIEKKASYSEIQNYFMDNLPRDTKLFNEFHALFVRLGKDICKNKSDCSICPLRDLEIRYQCDSCGKILERLQQRYILKIEVYASPEVVITKEDLKRDLQEEFKKILEELKTRKKEDLEKEVYTSYKLNLCKRCRDIFTKRIEHKEFI